MFRRFMKMRLAVVGLAAAGALALAVGAYAYFTSSGTSLPTTASAGSANAYTVTVTPSGSTTLYPTLTTDTNFTSMVQDYTGTVTNGSSGHQQVNKLTANITAVTPTGSNTCAASNFSLYSSNSGVWDVASDGQSATSTTGLPNDLAGGASLNFGGLGVYLVDLNADQNGCQGATVSLTVTAS